MTRTRSSAHIAYAFAVFLSCGCDDATPNPGTGPGPAASTANPAADPDAESPPLSPAEELRTFTLAEPELVVRLAAAEPLIESPVFATYDADGALWVVEMRTYMRDAAATGELEPKNRIRVLHDDDGDGVFDRAATFLDGLVLPRAVAPCFGGALVLEPPHLYFCKDVDGDGRADTKHELLGGFGGRDAPEHAGNGLLYGLDNRYELSQHPLRIRFDGTRAHGEPAAAHGQWGLTADEQGRLYYTPNSAALLYDFYSKGYPGRRKRGGESPGIGNSAASDHRTWPRTLTPVNRGYMDGVLGKDGRLRNLTAACSPLWFASDGLGVDLRGSVFLCEPAGNLLKRLTVSERDGVPTAKQAYDGREFLASTDPRFRPVHLCTTPEGDLLVVDMYRGLIQHKLYLTPYLRGKTDAANLTPPLDGGRIWRISRRDATRKPVRKLSAAPTAELVGLLQSRELRDRSTAQRLLVERQDPSALAAIRDVFEHPQTSASASHALWTLEGSGLLSDGVLMSALAHTRATVRVQALRLAESRLDRPAIIAAVAGLWDDEDRRVRVQCALTISAEPKLRDVLSKILSRYGDDSILRGAALTGLENSELAMMRAVIAPRTKEATSREATPSAEIKSVVSALTDQRLRAGSEGAGEILAFAAELLPNHRPLAEFVLARVAAKQKLDDASPRPLDLKEAPDALLAASANLPVDARRTRIERQIAWMDWPGRPPTDRPAAARPLTAEEKLRFAHGESLFVRCTACHGATGDGMGGLGPSLAASQRLDGPPEKIALVLLHGMEGEFPLGSATYRGAMPKAETQGNEDVAALITYLRRSFGHVQAPVDAAFVARIRASFATREKPWTTEELDAIRLH